MFVTGLLIDAVLEVKAIFTEVLVIELMEVLE